MNGAQDAKRWSPRKHPAGDHPFRRHNKWCSFEFVSMLYFVACLLRSILQLPELASVLRRRLGRCYATPSKVDFGSPTSGV
jgi:hypothetical protein